MPWLRSARIDSPRRPRNNLPAFLGILSSCTHLAPRDASRALCGKVTSLPRAMYAPVAARRCRGRPFGRAALTTFVAVVVGFATTRSDCAPPMRVPESDPYSGSAGVGAPVDSAQLPPAAAPAQTWPDGQPV